MKRVLINGSYHKEVLFKVETEDEDGRPENCTLIPDDRNVEIVGGERFFKAYIPEQLLK